MKDLRQAVRYAVDTVYCGMVSVELRGKERRKGRVIDLSVSGLSFETDLSGGNSPDGIINGGDFFITLNVNEESLLIGVEKIWSLADKSGHGATYKAGVKFKILADDDRIKLNNIIEKIRESIQNTARMRQRP